MIVSRIPRQPDDALAPPNPSPLNVDWPPEARFVIKPRKYAFHVRVRRVFAWAAKAVKKGHRETVPHWRWLAYVHTAIVSLPVAEDLTVPEARRAQLVGWLIVDIEEATGKLHRARASAKRAAGELLPVGVLRQVAWYNRPTTLQSVPSLRRDLQKRGMDIDIEAPDFNWLEDDIADVGRAIQLRNRVIARKNDDDIPCLIDVETSPAYKRRSRQYGKTLAEDATYALRKWAKTLPLDVQKELREMHHVTKDVEGKRNTYPTANYEPTPKQAEAQRLADVICPDRRTHVMGDKAKAIIVAKVRDPKVKLAKLARILGCRDDYARDIWKQYRGAIEALRRDMEAVGFSTLPTNKQGLNELLCLLNDHWGIEDAPLNIGNTWTRIKGAE